jgi:protein-S-isoprenylcysteine O-methyltransferase
MLALQLDPGQALRLTTARARRSDMYLPASETLGIAFGLSELALSIVRRSGTTSAATDRASLSLLWLVILASVAAGVAAAYLVPQAHSMWLARVYPLGVAIFAAGLVLRWWAIVRLGRFFTVDVAIAVDHRVVDTGPYRWVRHPAYLGVLLAFFGLGICIGNWVSLAVLTLPILGAFLRRIAVEEAALTAALGEDYRAYARRTRRLLPFLY